MAWNPEKPCMRRQMADRAILGGPREAVTRQDPGALCRKVDGWYVVRLATGATFSSRKAAKAWEIAQTYLEMA